MRGTTLILCLALLLGACGGGNNSGPSAADDDHNGDEQPTAPSGPSAADKRRAEELYQEGRQASVQKNRTRAAELLRKAVELDPDYREAHANLGRVLHDLGYYEEALEHHLRAGELENDLGARRFLHQKAAEDCMALADKAMDAGEYARAEKLIREAVELGRESHSRLSRLGDALYQQEKYEEAEQAYRRAAGVTAGEERHLALFRAGKIRYEQEDYEGAETTFTELIREDYTGQDVFAWRGYCRYRLGNLEGALEDYTRAQRHATSDENAREYAETEGRLMRELYADD